ncbi:YncE family protein [Nocardia asteroides]|uniref:YncE family protein n=1 Tax=Nocardia asteroides TaxID=1824 RepID=UPI001E3B5875|nr:hypothetical protein [Nocardia asteroides]UGT64561.1 hypothetical protein LTT61_15285 [Nocardia asteroides]
MAAAMATVPACTSEIPGRALPAPAAAGAVAPVASTSEVALDIHPIGAGLDESTGEIYLLAQDVIVALDSKATVNGRVAIPGADDIAFDSTHHTAWVTHNARANDPADRVVELLDTRSKQRIGSVEVLHPALAVAVDTSANRAFVVHRPDDQTQIPELRAWVSVFDTATRRLIDTVELPFAAYEIEIDPETHVALIAGWMTAVVMSTQTLAIDPTPSLSSRSSSVTIAVDSRDGTGYAVSDDVLSVIALDSNSVTDIAIGWEDGRMAPGPDETLLVTDFDDNSLMVIDPASGVVRSRIPVNTESFGVVSTPDRRTVYVYSQAAESVTVVEF